MRHFRKLGWPQVGFDQLPVSHDPGDSRISKKKKNTTKSSAFRASRKRFSKKTLSFLGNLCPGLQILSEPRGETPPKFRWCHYFICGMLEDTAWGSDWTEPQQTEAAFTLSPSLLLCCPQTGIAGQRSWLEFFCEGHETMPAIDNDWSKTMK